MRSPPTSLARSLNSLADIAVIFPLHIPIPANVLREIHSALVTLRIVPRNGSTPLKARHVHLNFVTVPLISVLLLLAAGVFDGKTIRDGVVGTDGIKPINIMALFISLVRSPCEEAHCVR